MESFSGNLAHYRLQLVMPALFEGPEPATGMLKLQRGATRREFSLRRGLLVYACSNEPREHLAQVLANLNILEAARAAAAFEAAAGSRVPLGTFLVDRGFVELPRVTEALAHKAREALFDCYDWESGEVSYVPGESRPIRGIELKLPLGAMHRDALARMREWRLFREIFPAPDISFDVFREWAAVWGTQEEESLMELAEGGATLGELLASAPEGPLFAARRLLQLYRRGVISPRAGTGPRLGESLDVTQLLTAAREFLAQGEFANAAAVAAQALERAAVPEAQMLYREAEMKLALKISDEVLQLEGRLRFAIARHSPPEITADDYYLYARLKSARSVRQALRDAAMGELAAYQSLQRLIRSGLIYLTAPGPVPPRRKTDPFGFPAVA